MIPLIVFAKFSSFKPLNCYSLPLYNFVIIKTLQYHSALSTIKTFVNFKGPLNQAIV